MKKSLSSILILLCISAMVFGQKYYVVSVKGAVYANGKLLKKKDKIRPDDKLVFSTPASMAYLVSPGKGYFILSPKSSKMTVQNDFTTYVKNALLPPNQFFSASTRGIPPKALNFREMKEVEDFFKGEILLVREATITVGANKIPLSHQRYFKFVYKNQNGGRENITLSQAGRQFFLRADQFPKSKTEQSLESELFYVDGFQEAETLVGKFTLNIVPEKDIKQALKKIRKETDKDTNVAFYVNHALPLLEAQYGKHAPEDILRILGEK